jgi:hypothetical protein
MQAFQAVLLTLAVLVIGLGAFLLFVVKPLIERASSAVESVDQPPDHLDDIEL